MNDLELLTICDFDSPTPPSCLAPDPAKHFHIKWGRDNLVGIIYPLDLNTVNKSVKSNWKQIPIVPTCSAGPEIQKLWVPR